MTLPMMPGWFDESKESLQSLAQTAMRSFNPLFDNQMALSQFMRQNPANQQQMVDMASLNPELIKNMFGEKALANLQLLGNPSSAATVEGVTRSILSKPLSEVPGTVAGEAATKALGLGTSSERKTEKLQQDATSQQTNYYSILTDQTKFENAMKNPSIKARYDALNAMIESSPDMAGLDPLGLAMEFRRGTVRPGFGKLIDGLANVNPTAYKAFLDYVGILGEAEDKEFSKAQADRAYERAKKDTDDILMRQILDDARSMAREGALPFDEVVNYLTGKPTSSRVVQDFLDAKQGMAERRARFIELGKVGTAFASYAKSTEAQKSELAINLSAQLSALVGAPVSIERISGDWWKKESQFTVGDMKMNGTQFQQLLYNPEQTLANIAADAELNSKTMEQLDAEIADLKANQNQIAPAVYGPALQRLVGRRTQLLRERQRERR